MPADGAPPPPPPRDDAGPAACWALLRRNARFRRLFLGELANQAGTWLTYIAVLRAVDEGSGSGGGGSATLLVRKRERAKKKERP